MDTLYLVYRNIPRDFARKELSIAYPLPLAHEILMEPSVDCGIRLEESNE